MSRQFRRPPGNRINLRSKNLNSHSQAVPFTPIQSDTLMSNNENWFTEHKYKIATVFLALITLIITAGSTYSSWKQSLAADIQANAALEQTIAAKEQAIAAKEQVTAAKQQAIASDDQAASTRQQAKAADIQTSLSNQQTQLSQNQYDATLPHLNVSVVDQSPTRSFIMPIDKQTDGILKLVRKYKYRIVIELNLSNLSSMPISITNMAIIFPEDNVDAWKTMAKTDSYSLDETSMLPIGNEEYPDVFILQPYEAIRKFAIFPTDYFPAQDKTPAVLIVLTSRGSFSSPFIVHKLPVSTKIINKGFKFEFNSINDHNPNPNLPRFVPID